MEIIESYFDLKGVVEIGLKGYVFPAIPFIIAGILYFLSWFFQKIGMKNPRFLN